MVIDKTDSRAHRKGLSLHRFAVAKKSGYDKKAKAEKKAAINAKRVNKFKKLKQRLARESVTSLTSSKAVDEDGSTDPDTKRARSRAGPPPDEAQSMSHDSVGLADSEVSDDELQSPQHESNGLLSEEDATEIMDHPIPKVKRRIDAELPNTAKIEQQKHKTRKKPPSQLQRLATKLATEKLYAMKEEKRAKDAIRAQERQAKQERVAAVEKERKKQRELYLKKTKRGQPVMKYRIDRLLSQLQAE